MVADNADNIVAQIMYSISPLICFTVVGALKACRSAMAAA